MANLQLVRSITKEIIDLSTKSAILADKKSIQFCDQYLKLRSSSDNSQASYLQSLCTNHGFKTERLLANINSLSTNQLSDFKLNYSSYEKLNTNLNPDYCNLFQNLGRVKDGVSTLVKIREDLLNILEKRQDIKNEDELKIMNLILKKLLTLWFTTGLLNIQRIDWNSPAALVEKVAQYESVHQIRTLSDLKTRLSSNRRCFIYTHSTMPYEPLVILHIALTNTVSSNIRDVIKNSSNDEDKNYTNAIFYSINSCQKGLQQVDLGNALIKSCVKLLVEEIPSLSHFHTLSPIPKFREWLDLKINSYDQTTKEYFNLNDTLTADEKSLLISHFKLENNFDLFSRIRDEMNSRNFRLYSTDDLIYKTLESFLKRACSFYLFYEKKGGYAFNSVANFHLRNGAEIYRVNFKGNTSENGWKSSYGMMVNYVYYLDKVSSNCIDYLIKKEIKCSDVVKNDLKLFNFSTKN